MSRVDLGKVTFLPYDNLYPYFEKKVDGLENGGYHITDGKCFILASSNSVTVNSLTFPTPKETINIVFIKNGEIVEQEFAGTISNTSGCSIFLQFTYEVL